VIADNPDRSQSEVGEALAIKRANMVPIIARLIKRELVARTRVDGRSLALRVTAAGAAQAAEALQRIAKHEARFKATLKADDLETVLRALRACAAIRPDSLEEQHEYFEIFGCQRNA